MISHRILGCLFLILLSQYSNARKSNYGGIILNSLQRIENLLFKQSTQQTLNCLVPIEKLFALISEASNDDSNEIPKNLPDSNVFFLQKELGLDNEKNVVPFLKKSTEKNRNYVDNKNYNENINTNINKNIDRARRTLDDSVVFHNFNKLRNRNYNINMNANKNINRKATDFTDFIDENEA